MVVEYLRDLVDFGFQVAILVVGVFITKNQKRRSRLDHKILESNLKLENLLLSDVKATSLILKKMKDKKFELNGNVDETLNQLSKAKEEFHKANSELAGMIKK